MQYQDYPLANPKDDEVIIELKAAALNHRDVFIAQGQYANIQLPVILGSDGAGITGDREVIINPSINWGNMQAFQGPRFEVLGMPRNGTFAQNIIIPQSQVHEKPGHLNWPEAAALPLAGLTAFRALFKQGQLKPGQKVLITGIGGGVALFALQFALSAGAQVWGTSGSEEKINRAKNLGARGGANYKTENWHKQLDNRFDLIIDSAGGKGFANLLSLADYGARIVVYGGTQGKVNGISPQKLFWKQVSIIGSTMGSPEDFSDMLNFVKNHKIRPIIDSSFPLLEANEAFQRMHEGLQFGKIVLDIQ